MTLNSTERVSRSRQSGSTWRRTEQSALNLFMEGETGHCAVSMRDTAPSQDTALAHFNQLSRRDILQPGGMSVCVRRKLRAVGRLSPCYGDV